MSAKISTNQRTADVASSTREICRAIKHSDTLIRQKYPVLYYQDCIATTIFVGSILLMLLFSYLYIYNHISAVITIVLVALSISVLHEMEHDLIHNLYFKNYKWVQNVMFLMIWGAKMHISPWYRRRLHLKHHLLSGQKSDAEERFIGLGLPPSFTRMAVSMHPFAGLLIIDDISKDAKYFDVFTVIFYNTPVGLIFFLIIQLFLGYNLLFLISFYTNYDINFIWGSQTIYPIMRNLTVCLCFPNLLRQGCLVLMSTSTHYYADIPLNTVFYQNQILDSWYVIPFQLFCFNFGATHIVHYYVPSQPFYIRHFTARSVKDLMIKLGVRNNDFGILWRNNRYTIDQSEDQQQQLYGKIWLFACFFVGLSLYLVWDAVTFYVFSEKTIAFIRKKSTSQTKTDLNDELVHKNEITDEEGIKALNAWVNQMVLSEVSAEQIDEMSKKAVEAYH